MGSQADLRAAGGAGRGTATCVALHWPAWAEGVTETQDIAPQAPHHVSCQRMTSRNVSSETRLCRQSILLRMLSTPGNRPDFSIA